MKKDITSLTIDLIKKQGTSGPIGSPPAPAKVITINEAEDARIKTILDRIKSKKR